MNVAYNQIDDNAIVALNDADLDAVSGGTLGLLFGLLSFKLSLFSNKSGCNTAPKCKPEPTPCKPTTPPCGKPC
ncbi:hypothetical protein PARHAE_02796 [Paracoccus haematequi]|uniref:Uncharacterized protein n=1 Tax=Paracoccus haematequi TaxID=2491866 RepID=A0A447IPX6_9RHOB|nr:hypothetical protein [Paracoccus haematequi]VDS09593.1 hypothetical protein PARHAE_02796 [Paracoccus haematequi]